MNEIVRVGIAGQGRSGYSIHAHWLRQAADRFRIVAVADELPERRRDAEREFGARSFRDYRTLIARGGFDLFVNALPTPLHAPGTIAALEAGYHVVCEKPFAGTVRDVDRMAAAARANRRHLFPFQNNRHQPCIEKIREVIASGVLGDILLIRSVWGHFARRWDWQTLRRNLGGMLYNTGPHAIDQMLSIIGFDRKFDVFCRMECRNRLGGDAEDLCFLTLQGRDMPRIEIVLSHYEAYPPADMYTICGTLGGMAGGATALRWKYYDPRQAPKQRFWKRWSVDRRYPSETLPWIEKTWTIDEERARHATGYTLRSFTYGVKKFYDNVHAVIAGGAAPLITVPQVRRQIAVIEECQRQNRHIWPAGNAGQAGSRGRRRAPPRG